MVKSMNIGIIQGRLTPSDGVIQKFPDGKWLAELFTARRIGFTYIEWLADASFNAENPVWTGEQLEQVREGIKSAGLVSHSLCVDHIMKRPLTIEDASEAEKRYNDLLRIISNGYAFGITHVVLPFLEGASLKDNPKKTNLANEKLKRLLANLKGKNISFCVETDLNTQEHESLLRDLPDSVGICLDTGNRTSFGFDPSEEILYWDKRLLHVHIKDKDQAGKNVLLGTGLVDFDHVFESFRQIGYSNAFTLETNRGENEEESAIRHIAFLKNLITKYELSKY